MNMWLDVLGPLYKNYFGQDFLSTHYHKCGINQQAVHSAHSHTLTVPLLATMDLEWSVVTARISEQKQIYEGADHVYTRWCLKSSCFTFCD